LDEDENEEEEESPSEEPEISEKLKAHIERLTEKRLAVKCKQSEMKRQKAMCSDAD